MPDRIITHIPEETFWDLPRARRADGGPRRAGVEIEFAGLHEDTAAALVRDRWGGRVERIAAHDLRVVGTEIGEVRIELDTALRRYSDAPLAGSAIELSRSVVPVEVILPPLEPLMLDEVGDLMQALHAAGAQGSNEGTFYAFGLHLNIEIAAAEAEFVVPVARAFALMEDWLRRIDPPDRMRRILPFVDPYPRGWIDAIAAEGGNWSLRDLASHYLHHNPTRNRGLDLLPLVEYLFADMAKASLKSSAKGGRPTWHYRLPEARFDRAGGGVAAAWNRWCLVERVAARRDLLGALAAEWAAHRGAATTLRGDWAPVVARLLHPARIWQA